MLIFVVGYADSTFTKSGFSNWRNDSRGSKILAKHVKSRMHLLSLEQTPNFKSATSIDIKLNKTAREMRR